MKIFKCSIFSALTLICSVAFGEKQSVVIYVDDSYKPYSYSEGKRAVGVYNEVLRAVFEQMSNFEVQLEPVPWQRGKRLMETGEGFGLAPAFFHGHDWPYLYPYSIHFNEETIITVCRAEVLMSPRSRWPEDYIGLHVQNVAGFDGWGGDRFRELVAQEKIQYSEVRGVESSILMLGLKRADCILAEEISFDDTYARLRESGRYDDEVTHSELKKGALVGPDPVYIGYSQPGIEQGKFPFHKQFMRQFDIALYKLKKSGEVGRIMQASLRKHPQ